MTGWRHNIGRRGTALIILAAADFGYGTSLLAGHPPAPTVATEWATPGTLGTIWLITGIICLTGAFTSADQVAFAAAALLKTAWAAGTAAWAADHQAPGGWGTAFIWLATAALVILIAGWPEVPRR